MALMVVLALSGSPALADGGGSQPNPAPYGASTYSEIDGVLLFFDAVSSVVNLV